MDYIVVGEVLKAQGIRGEIKIKPLTDDPARFRKLRAVYIDERIFRISSCRINENVFLKLDGIEDRNEAEKLVGKFVRIDRLYAVTPDDDSYFIVDLIGCEIHGTDEDVFGTVIGVDNYGSADVITARAKNGKVFRFPFLKRVLYSVDTDKKIIKVDSRELESVCVYED
ncbi:MAG: 16S rRNA processing protein RimM [Clostridia bacterium]|nr:16S rRNA processing protein RimM [Clostridia bacterium]